MYKRKKKKSTPEVVLPYEYLSFLYPFIGLLTANKYFIPSIFSLIPARVLPNSILSSNALIFSGYKG